MPRGTRPGDHDLGIGNLLVHHAERVDQGGEHHDRGTVLVVVEHRDVELLAQPALDLETARSGDVLEIHPAVHGRDRLDDRDDLLGVLGVQAHRPGINVGEPLEQRCLAFHHWQRSGWPEVAKTEDGCAVGDHRDGVALHRETSGIGGLAAIAIHTRATPGV